MLEDQVLARGARAKIINYSGRKDVRFTDHQIVVVALIVARISICQAVIPGTVLTRVFRARISAEDFVFVAEVVINPAAELPLIDRESDQRQVVTGVGKWVIWSNIRQRQIFE